MSLGIKPLPGKHSRRLRTCPECAEALGITQPKLVALLRLPGAPKFVVRHKYPCRTYYDIDEVKAWHKSL